MRTRLALALLLFASAAAAQLTEKVEVSLVNVDVTVTSRGGPVRSLARDDFEVLEDGVVQPITNFTAVESGAPADREAAADERFRRRVLVVIDNTHMAKFNRNRAVEELEKFVDKNFQSGAYDWSVVMVAGGGSARLILPQTSDKDQIHRALNAIRRAAAATDVNDQPLPGCKLSESTAQAVRTAIDHGDSDAMSPCGFASMIALKEELMRSGGINRSILDSVRAFAGTPGKKAVLVITGDLGLHDARDRDVAKEMAAVRDSLIREANASNVSVFIFNVEGLQPGGDVASGPVNGHAFFRMDQFTSRGSLTDNSFMDWISRETGGRLLSSNSVAHSMGEFEAATANYYSLAYRAPHGEDQRYHEIKVRLKKRGNYDLRYRAGYASASRELQLLRALKTPLGINLQNATIPLTATVGEVKDLEIPIEAHIPLGELQFIPSANGWSARVDLYVSVFDEDGRVLLLKRFNAGTSAPSAPADGDLVHNARIKLDGGKPRLVVLAVRDVTTDAIGTWRQTIAR